MGDIKDLKEDGGALVGDLTDDGAKGNVMPFGRRRGGRGGAPAGGGPGGPGGAGGGFTSPESNQCQRVRQVFWIKDGVLTKYEMKNSGTMSFGGNDVEINRTVNDGRDQQRRKRNSKLTHQPTLLPSSASKTVCSRSAAWTAG